jgi:hypothetical protein
MAFSYIKFTDKKEEITDSWSNVQMKKRKIYEISVGKNEDDLENFPG